MITWNNKDIAGPRGTGSAAGVLRIGVFLVKTSVLGDHDKEESGNSPKGFSFIQINLPRSRGQEDTLNTKVRISTGDLQSSLLKVIV